MPSDEHPRTSGLSESATEREFLKYLPSSHFRLHHEHHIPVSSADLALNAFAQLGALRLRASRCYISLFDRTSQYIIAESSKTLSTQNDTVHDRGDELWLGQTRLPRHPSPCSVLVDKARAKDVQSSDNPIKVVLDMSESDIFQGESFMQGKAAWIRFYANILLISPRGAIIGSYAVLDEKPHESISPTEIQYLKDMAKTVMDHLVLSRTRDENRRMGRMMGGIGRFLGGYAGLESGPSNGYSQDVGATPKPPSIRGIASGDYFSYEKSHQNNSANGQHISSRPSPQRSTSVNRSSNMSSSPSDNATTPNTIASSPGPGSDVSGSDILVTFSRAANIIRESMDMDGVIFFDASINSHGGLLRSEDPASFPSTDTSNRDDSQSRTSSSTESEDRIESKRTMCKILGYSELHRIVREDERPPTPSDIDRESPERKKVSPPKLREKDLQALLRRYPYGRIINFDRAGKPSSGSSGGEGVGTPATDKENGELVGADAAKRKRRKKASSASFDAMVGTTLPGARSVAVLPVWDSHQERWYAGGLIWTTRGDQLLITNDHLDFLMAISSTIMTEVARVNALKSDRVKADVLRSISHELRSPLHGILGSVELLEGSAKSAFEVDMMHSIETCGRTLLDTLDHLLDYTKVNRTLHLKKQGTRLNPKFGTRAANTPGESETRQSAVRLDLITEEVVAAVSSGFAAQKRSSASSSKTNTHINYSKSNTLSGLGGDLDINEDYPKAFALDDLSVVLDVDKSMKTDFMMSAGAWRRIVMNIFANSLKYTGQGYIRVKLVAKPTKHSLQKKVILTITDTGRGMSEDFLRNRVFMPFSQEDSLSSGTGLGLSIVKQIVNSCKGRILIDSKQDVGTKITVSINMLQSQGKDAEQVEGTLHEYDLVSKMTTNLSVCLLDKGWDHSRESIVSRETLSVLTTSLKEMARDWYGMTLNLESESKDLTHDIYLAVEASSSVEQDIDRILNHAPITAHASRQKPILIAFCQSSVSRVEILDPLRDRHRDSMILEYVNLPCGVYRLGKALAVCMKRQSVELNNKIRPARTHSPITPTRLDPPSTHDLKPHDKLFNITEETSKTPNPKSDILASLALRSPSPPPPPSPPAHSEIVDSIHPGNETASVAADSPLSPMPPTFAPSASSQTFLLVDDNPINLRLLAAVMKRKAAPHITAEDGAQAVASYTADPSACSVVLMDISMPIMDGLAATRAIRQLEKQRGLKPCHIIVVTGLASEEVQREADASGADGYMVKPVKWKELERVLSELENKEQG